MAVTVLVLAAVAGNSLLRQHERSALRTCVRQAESDLDDLAYRTAGLEVYIASAVDRPDVDPAVRRSLRGIVQETMLRSLPALQRDQNRCAGVRAWHGTVRDGRSAYAAYLAIRVDQVQRAVVDLDALHVVLPDLAPARERARVALAKAGVRLSP